MTESLTASLVGFIDVDQTNSSGARRLLPLAPPNEVQLAGAQCHLGGIRGATPEIHDLPQSGSALRLTASLIQVGERAATRVRPRA